MNVEKYKYYSVEEWVRDKLFRAYILHHDLTYEQEWIALSSENDEIFHRIREATAILNAMSDLYQEYEEDGGKRAESSFAQLGDRLGRTKGRSKRSIIALAVSVAASIAIVGFTVWLTTSSAQPTEFATTGDKIEEVILPDGSLVYLNENSRLKISPEWAQGIREVSLEGEGYFIVRSRKDSAGDVVKFTVKTNGLNIEVLGTQFNVNTRGEMTSVALDEGSIKLKEDHDEKNESYMVPGQVASFDRQSKKIVISEMDLTGEKTNWKPETIEFNHITLKDAINKMETVFDIHFHVNDEIILNLKIDKLSIPSERPEVFIKTLDVLFAGKISIVPGTKDNIYQIVNTKSTIDH